MVVVSDRVVFFQENSGKLSLLALDQKVSVNIRIVLVMVISFAQVAIHITCTRRFIVIHILDPGFTRRGP